MQILLCSNDRTYGPKNSKFIDSTMLTMRVYLRAREHEIRLYAFLWLSSSSVTTKTTITTTTKNWKKNGISRIDIIYHAAKTSVEHSKINNIWERWSIDYCLRAHLSYTLVLHTIVLPHHHHHLLSVFVALLRCCVIAVVYLYFEQISFILFRNSCHFFRSFSLTCFMCVSVRTQKSLFPLWLGVVYNKFFSSSRVCVFV